MMMLWGAEKGDAGSEVSLQSCDQTQSRRAFNIGINSLKSNKVNFLFHSNALGEGRTYGMLVSRHEGKGDAA